MTNANLPLPYADDVETIPADEADDIQQVVQALELILTRRQAKTGQFRADVHVKTHGYAQGEFRVLPNLPGELGQGLFEHDGIYPAVVRFSNAASQAQPDAIPDGRGMAIKVLSVEGDMVLADEQNMNQNAENPHGELARLPARGTMNGVRSDDEIKSSPAQPTQAHAEWLVKK